MNRFAVKNLPTRSLRSYSSVIDCHTHMYTPKYMDILRKRTEVPRILNVQGMDRYVILPGEDKEISTSVGRPIGAEYWDVNAKLEFMDQHNINQSVISLANPWLDFLSPSDAPAIAQELNDELDSICGSSNGRLYGFATLPVKNPKEALKEVKRLSSLSSVRGVILGTPGAGQGLDHPNMREVLHAISEAGLMVFLHPHYGVGTEHFKDTGHSLFLALGFPFETTVCLSRLIVTGVLDEIPNLKILVAHAGAALPGLIGRLDSCVYHEPAIANRLKRAPSDYFKDFFFDAISYGPDQLQLLVQLVGADRLVFGTDNPFFPPPPSLPPSSPDSPYVRWPSTLKVFSGIDQLALPQNRPTNESHSESQSQMSLQQMKDAILFGNARRLLNIPPQ